MMDQATRAKNFGGLHVKGDPIVLYNIWDAGGAAALAKAGAPAVATGSWSVAAAHGFSDREAIPLDFVLQIVERITATVDLPLSVDFEGGYATAPSEVAANVSRMIGAGAIGINLEDRIVKGEGLFMVPEQAARIRAVRNAADDTGVNLFINARTDVFLGSDPSTHKGRVSDAVERAAAYEQAGASGFFIPGLTDPALISEIVEAVSLPVNVMMMGNLTSIRDLANLGVSRVSYGPGAYVNAMADLGARYDALQ